MNGIELKAGVNNCHWNVDGFCTNKNVTRAKTIMSRDWDSKQNCAVTIFGVHNCEDYRAQKI